ncbi:MAG: heme exporter protein CcmD [Pseudomonadales bacterium]|nr:heme exporter protein CcmD [Pseudomonadales bacterium]
MFFDSFGAFLAMGGHAFYVWLAFGLTLLLILGNIWRVRALRRTFFRQYMSKQVRSREDMKELHL